MTKNRKVTEGVDCLKMTSIPIKKGSNVTRRRSHEVASEGPALEKNMKLKGHSNDGKENCMRPSVLTGTRKDLQEEIGRLQTQLGAAQSQASLLQGSLNNKQSELERVSTEFVEIRTRCETTLLTCNIDPVNLERLAPSEEDDVMLSKARQEAQEKVAMLRDRLTQMISLTSKQISGLKSQCLQLYSIGTKSQPEAPPENVLAMSE
ncbi:uncharacterized protein LOC128208048 isoform X2 [Mya arenaria]|uniref:uncharacterized protein LOC128208048 isoform X2 n=1 Tax=Mya arenaria TaxID=6604 RepID=UPI0022E3492D|nr:uncharacterized protein LOC128208048 isoform X2 [Mya arenaria]